VSQCHSSTVYRRVSWSAVLNRIRIVFFFGESPITSSWPLTEPPVAFARTVWLWCSVWSWLRAFSPIPFSRHAGCTSTITTNCHSCLSKNELWNDYINRCYARLLHVCSRLKIANIRFLSSLDVGCSQLPGWQCTSDVRCTHKCKTDVDAEK